MSKSIRRRGFTLPEVLVTITIVAVLAAVVVPAVLNQVSKGDTAGLAGDVSAMQTAISNFTSDTRHYPASILDLTTQISSGSNDLLGNPYGAAAAAAWKGPYFPTSQDIASNTGVYATGAYSTTAYNLLVQSDFEAPADSNNNFVTLRFSTSGTFSPSDVATIDRLFDAGDGSVPTSTSAGLTCTTTGGNATGAIRWNEVGLTGSCTITNLKWRLVPAAH